MKLLRKLKYVGLAALMTFGIGLGLGVRDFVSENKYRPVNPIAWYDFDGDGFKDAIIEWKTSELDSKHIKENAEINKNRIFQGKKPIWYNNDTYELCKIDGIEVLRTGKTNYLAKRSSIEPLGIQLYLINRSKFRPIMGVGDHDEDGKIDILIDQFEAHVPYNTEYPVKNPK